jgi:hypothetical protein
MEERARMCAEDDAKMVIGRLYSYMRNEMERSAIIVDQLWGRIVRHFGAETDAVPDIARDHVNSLVLSALDAPWEVMEHTEVSQQVTDAFGSRGCGLIPLVTGVALGLAGSVLRCRAEVYDTYVAVQRLHGYEAAAGSVRHLNQVAAAAMALWAQRLRRANSGS